MSSSSTTTTERHFFLFRHCFRSTGAKVDFYNTSSSNTTSKERYPTNDFLNASSALHWTVPNYQCTAQGLQYIQQTGEYLAREFLARQTNTTTVHFDLRIISDTSQRDLDTAVALKQGMQAFLKSHDSFKNNNKNQQNFQSTLDSLQIETNTAWFNPIQFGDCTQEYTNEHVLQDVRHNLQTVPRPSGLSLSHAVQLVRQHGGGHGVRPIPPSATTEPPQFLSPMQRTKPNNNTTKTHLQGAAINLIKSWAIMAYYSRAAAPTEMTFLPTLQWSQVYAIMAWQHWSRRVVEINTVQATVGGSQMARVLLEALDGNSTATREQHNDTMAKDSSNTHHTVHVTLVVGHDGDIDSLSSVLGAYWNAKPPFVAPSSAGQFWNPTPPGSALHLVQSTTTNNDNGLAVEYLYPVLAESTTTNNDPSSGFQLQTVPVYFVQETNGQQQHVNSTTLTDLRQRIHRRLQTAPGALDCFDQTVFDTTNMTTPKTKTSTHLGLTDTMDNYGSTLLVLVSILSLSGWLLYYYGLGKRRCCCCCSPTGGGPGKRPTLTRGDSLYESVAGSETELI